MVSYTVMEGDYPWSCCIRQPHGRLHEEVDIAQKSSGAVQLQGEGTPLIMRGLRWSAVDTRLEAQCCE